MRQPCTATSSNSSLAIHVVSNHLASPSCINSIGMTDISIQSISIDVLRAELQRRASENGDVKPACGTTGRRGSYNVPVHIFAVFLILIISFLGTNSSKDAGMTAD